MKAPLQLGEMSARVCRTVAIRKHTECRQALLGVGCVMLMALQHYIQENATAGDQFCLWSFGMKSGLKRSALQA